MPSIMRRSSWPLLAIILAIAASSIGCTSDSTAPNGGNGQWTTVAPMLTARTVAGAGVIGDRLYVIGGFSYVGNDPVTLSNVEEFDPRFNRWMERAPMPTPHGYLASGVVNGILYAVGGQDDPAGTSVILNSVEAYDPVTDTWTTKTSMPTARRGAAIGVVGGILYAIGGELSPAGSHNMSKAVEAYDPATDSWTTRAPMLTARDALSVTVINDTLYAIGGYDGVAYLPTVELYDPATDHWTTKAPMPTARAIATALALDGKLYVAGGYTGITTQTVESYDPAADNWTTKSPMPGSRAGHVGGVVNGKLYFVGGEVENGAGVPSILRLAEVFTP
jgi:N-acetylneuraminic acid mutarotase